MTNIDKVHVGELTSTSGGGINNTDGFNVVLTIQLVFKNEDTLNIGPELSNDPMGTEKGRRNQSVPAQMAAAVLGWLDIPRVDEPEIIDDLGLTADDVAGTMGDIAKRPIGCLAAHANHRRTDGKTTAKISRTDRRSKSSILPQAAQIFHERFWPGENATISIYT